MSLAWIIKRSAKSYHDLGKFNGVTFFVILLFHIIAITFAASTFSWFNFAVGFVFYVITGLGITLGYHRLFTHKSYTVKAGWLRWIIALMGTLSLQGAVIDWVADHFDHHNHSDNTGDPHSIRDGFWWSHIFWLFFDKPPTNQQQSMIKVLNRDKCLAFFSRNEVFVGSQVLLGILMLLVGGWSLVVWGIFVRVVFTWHVTWSINSVCHYFGKTKYPDSGDNSKNNFIMAILANGEGWHNNHHKFQSSARHGLHSGQFDLTWSIIVVLEKLKLVEINWKNVPVIDM